MISIIPQFKKIIDNIIKNRKNQTHCMQYTH